ncbi:MAG: Fe-S cluster assembly ATPase SufC [Gammaproteobacteria bacterium]|nr:Fe-S cluster assembly ATPase SufC [Gammaproteobacteria bacterium]MCH9715548.1 Fe-S cluster assembly ATPase SufC [Gammaproteobacteria bacterium]MCH9764345.1 Fe-S cluster assembly ATPase SufC [Gammaproteobacteria bacterium]
MLSIKNLQVSVEEQAILKGLNLEVKPGEVHAIMGPNGSGKSTLSKVIAGHPAYRVTDGDITYLDQDILPLSPAERAQAGVFLSFQYPVEIPGVANISFLKASVNAIREAEGKPPMDAMDFLGFIREKCAALEMDESFLYRNLNEGFSGGEKKRNEMLQLFALEPKLAILDETDSGLDIDALRVIANGINTMRASNRSIILVTHYQRLLNYVEPDYIHVLAEGKIIKSGDKSLAHVLEDKGYSWLETMEKS